MSLLILTDMVEIDLTFAVFVIFFVVSIVSFIIAFMIDGRISKSPKKADFSDLQELQKIVKNKTFSAYILEKHKNEINPEIFDFAILSKIDDTLFKEELLKFDKKSNKTDIIAYLNSVEVAGNSLVLQFYENYPTEMNIIFNEINLQISKIRNALNRDDV